MATKNSVGMLIIGMVVMAYTVEFCSAASAKCIGECVLACLKVGSTTQDKCSLACEQGCNQVKGLHSEDDWISVWENISGGKGKKR